MELDVAHFIDVGPSAVNGDALHFSVVDAFCKTVQTAVQKRPTTLVVICPQDDTFSSLRNAILLFGSYLLLCHHKTSEDVVENLTDSSQDMINQEWLYQMGIVDVWSALEHAKSLNWLAAPDCADEPALEIDVAAHYALPANGGLHIVVPDKLLLFPAPAPLPAGRSWADASTADGAPRRRFGAAFLAELLAELGVSAVVCLGQTGRSDAAAFRRCGLDVHDLGLDPRRPALLGAMDRLLALARAAPGAVAVCGWGGDDWGAGQERLRALGAAWLMTEGGFGSGAAEAWVGMACAAPAAAGLVAEE